MQIRPTAIALALLLAGTVSACGTDPVADTATDDSTLSSPLPTFEPGRLDATAELPDDQAALVGPDPSWGWMSAEACAEPYPNGRPRCTVEVVYDLAEDSCGLAYVPLARRGPLPRETRIAPECEDRVVID